MDECTCSVPPEELQKLLLFVIFPEISISWTTFGKNSKKPKNLRRSLSSTKVPYAPIITSIQKEFFQCKISIIVIESWMNKRDFFLLEYNNWLVLLCFCFFISFFFLVACSSRNLSKKFYCLAAKFGPTDVWGRRKAETNN